MDGDICRSIEQFGDSGFHIWKRSPLKQSVHSHDYIQMWYVKSGTCSHIFDGTAYRMTKGDLFILPPYVFHGMEGGGDGFELIGLDFTAEFIGGDGQNTGFLSDNSYIKPFIVKGENVKPSFSPGGRASEAVGLLLEEMLSEYGKKDSFYMQIIKANLLKILALVAREYERECGNASGQDLMRRRKQLIEPVLLYMHNNYQNKLTLEEASKMAALSPAYFSYIFKYVTGRSFTNQLNFIRVMKAKEQLCSSGKPVTEIAYESGFNDISYFGRVFKKEVGMSPAKYRIQ